MGALMLHPGWQSTLHPRYKRQYGLPVAGGYVVYPMAGHVARVLAAPVPLPAPTWAGGYHGAWQATHTVLVQGLRPGSKPRTILVRPHAPGLRCGYAPCVLVA